MLVIKKDFVNEDTESYCSNHKKLSSGKAYFLLDGQGNIHFAGKQCAEKYSKTDLSTIPDLTKSLVSNHENPHVTGGNLSGGNNKNDLTKAKAIAYMLLREERLRDFTYNKKSLSYEPLRKYNEQYQKTYDLPENAINHILAIEKKSVENFSSKLSLKNLSTCYAYHFILNRTLTYLEKKEKTGGIHYISGILNDLKVKCILSANQIQGLANWLQYLPKDLKESKLKSFDL